MQKYYYYQIEKPKKNLFFKLYIHKIGFYRFNWHKSIELMLIIKGNVEVCVEGERYYLEEDDLILINSNCGHATLAKEPESMAMVLHLDPIYFEEYMKEYKYLKFDLVKPSIENNKKIQKARNLLSKLLIELEGEAVKNQILVESYLSMISAKLIDIFSPVKVEAEYVKKNKEQKETISKMLNFIEENHRDKITLERLAEVLGYNTSYVSQYFKRNIGINFYDYLTRIRLREATIELSTSDYTITEIALKNGFPNVKSFNINFKKAFGKTPSQYCREIRNKKSLKQIALKRDFIEFNNKIVKQKIEQYQKNHEKSFFNESQIKVKEVESKVLEQIQILLDKSEERNEELKNMLTEANKEIKKLKNILL